MKTRQEILDEIEALKVCIRSLDKLIDEAVNDMAFNAHNDSRMLLKGKQETLEWVLI